MPSDSRVVFGVPGGDLEAEKARLKKLLAESMLDYEALKAALSGKY